MTRLRNFLPLKKVILHFHMLQQGKTYFLLHAIEMCHLRIITCDRYRLYLFVKMYFRKPKTFQSTYASFIVNLIRCCDEGGGADPGQDCTTSLSA